MTLEPPATALAGLAGIVFAAGGATRFGAPKQLARLDGVELVVHAARRAIACCPAGVIVVTGAYAAEVREALNAVAVQFAHNDAWETGLASSLRCGVAALPAQATACLLMLCDQPRVDAGALRNLAARWAASPGQVAASQYADSLGVPAIVPRDLWRGLLDLRGDQGARALIAALGAVTAVSLPGVDADVDTPGDLDRLRDP
jgi:CTP:molybdopterin cytidylyltransferase MocA